MQSEQTLPASHKGSCKGKHFEMCFESEELTLKAQAGCSELKPLSTWGLWGEDCSTRHCPSRGCQPVHLLPQGKREWKHPEGKLRRRGVMWKICSSWWAEWGEEWERRGGKQTVRGQTEDKESLPGLSPRPLLACLSETQTKQLHGPYLWPPHLENICERKPLVAHRPCMGNPTMYVLFFHFPKNIWSLWFVHHVQ